MHSLPPTNCDKRTQGAIRKIVTKAAVSRQTQVRFNTKIGFVTGDDDMMDDILNTSTRSIIEGSIDKALKT